MLNHGQEADEAAEGREPRHDAEHEQRAGGDAERGHRARRAVGRPPPERRRDGPRDRATVRSLQVLHRRRERRQTAGTDQPGHLLVQAHAARLMQPASAETPSRRRHANLDHT
jgi:hypothetical protein